ncbi:DUF2878 domain-containing protein [Aliivibrio fischeri]|uniref:DUF2878 domain-containing protein n=1 Tax=Aliivibrio fischeri TaxID=668 RepID=UPI0012DA6499|nr:DUF2878 domain-containing protein [Aliivibrio fischeri]MUK64419.1 DUF2878 family protein [Aliivibrio fischeri]
MQRYFPLINAVWFQLAWLAAIIYKQQAIPFLLLSVLIHLWVSPSRKQDAMMITFIGIIGVISDSFLSLIDIFSFANNVIIPIWLIMIWAHFSIALNHSLKWLNRFHIVAISLFGAIAGPLNYLAGQRLGGVEFVYSLNITLFAVAVIWAVNLPVFIIIQKRINKRIQERGSSYVEANQDAHSSGVVNNK